MNRYLTGECPNCGTRSLVSTTADAGGALDVDGNTVKAGDHLHACDSCGALIAKPKPATKAKAPAKKRAKRPAKKPAKRTAQKTRTPATRTETKPATPATPTPRRR